MLVKMKSGRVANLPEKAAEKLLKIGLCTAVGEVPKAKPKATPKTKKQS